MNTLLWIGQGVLSALFLAHGIMYLRPPQQILEVIQNTSLPAWMFTFIGVMEILAAVGLILPRLLRIAPILTPIAAIGLVVVMIGAVIFHASRGEVPATVVTALLGVIAGLVAWGRWG